MDKLKSKADMYASKLGQSSFMDRLMTKSYVRLRFIWGSMAGLLVLFFMFLGLGHIIFSHLPLTTDLVALFGVFCGFAITYLIVFFIFAMLMIRDLKKNGAHTTEHRHAVYTQLICVCVFTVMLVCLLISYMGTQLLCETTMYKASDTCTGLHMIATGVVELMIAVVFLIYHLALIMTEKKIVKSVDTDEPIHAETAHLLGLHDDDSGSVFSN